MKIKNNFNIMKMIMLFFVVFSSKAILAQIEYPEDKAKWKFSIEQKGAEATLIGKIKIGYNVIFSHILNSRIY